MENGTVLRSSYSRIISIVALAAFVVVQCPAFAERSVELTKVDLPQQADAVVNSSGESKLASDDKPVLIAQACASCGADLADVAVAAGLDLANSKRDKSLLTDSLW